MRSSQQQQRQQQQEQLQHLKQSFKFELRCLCLCRCSHAACQKLAAATSLLVTYRKEVHVAKKMTAKTLEKQFWKNLFRVFVLLLLLCVLQFLTVVRCCRCCCCCCCRIRISNSAHDVIFTCSMSWQQQEEQQHRASRRTYEVYLKCKQIIKSFASKWRNRFDSIRFGDLKNDWQNRLEQLTTQQQLTAAFVLNKRSAGGRVEESIKGNKCERERENDHHRA